MVICPALRSDDLKSLAWWEFDVLASAFSSPSHNEYNNNIENGCYIRRSAVRMDVMFRTVFTRTDCSGIFLLSQYAQLSVHLWNKQNKTCYLRMLWYVQNLLASEALQSFTLAWNKFHRVTLPPKKCKLAKCHAPFGSALRFCHIMNPVDPMDTAMSINKLSKNFLRHRAFTHTSWPRTDTDCAYKIIHPFKHVYKFLYPHLHNKHHILRCPYFWIPFITR